MAQDLRAVVAAMKMAVDLERIGDYAKNIAKRADRAGRAHEPMKPVTVDRAHGPAGRCACTARTCSTPIPPRTRTARRAVWRRDEEVDEHYNSLFRELLTYMMGDPRTIRPCTHLLFIAKNLERIGDHATNIAEIIHYQVHGRDLDEERPKGDTTNVPIDA